MTRHRFIFHPCKQTAWQQANQDVLHPSPNCPLSLKSLWLCPQIRIGWWVSRPDQLQPWPQGHLVMAPCLPEPEFLFPLMQTLTNK